MQFRKWLEFEEKDFGFYKNLILGKLNLSDDGLNTMISTWKPSNLLSILNSLGEFKELSNSTQEEITNDINSGNGTVGDLVQKMASNK